MSIQDFSEGLTSILQELTTLREENAKLCETISSLENEKSEVMRILGLRLGELSSSLEETRKLTSEAGSSVIAERRGKTILECFKKYVVAVPSDYAMIEEILQVKCCKVPTIFVGTVVAEAIIGKCAGNTTTIFTFDEKSVVEILLKYGFIAGDGRWYSFIKNEKKTNFVVVPFVSTRPSFSTYVAYMKNMYVEPSWVYYDGNSFEHFNPKMLKAYASRLLHCNGNLPMEYTAYDSNRVTFRGDHLTMRSLKKSP
jgi:hypothetical protein